MSRLSSIQVGTYILAFSSQGTSTIEQTLMRCKEIRPVEGVTTNYEFEGLKKPSYGMLQMEYKTINEGNAADVPFSVISDAEAKEWLRKRQIVSQVEVDYAAHKAAYEKASLNLELVKSWVADGAKVISQPDQGFLEAE